MQAVRSKGNKTTEERLIKIFGKIRLQDGEDIYAPANQLPFRKEKVTVFVDGCFWQVPKMLSWPKTNTEFWRNKIETNVNRTKVIDLSELGVCRIWECQLKKPNELQKFRNC